MSETLYMRISTQNSVLTAPDEHMPYIIQLHIMSMRWTYYEQVKQQNSDHFIWLVSEKKTEAVKAYLIKNSEEEGREGGGGGRQREKRREKKKKTVGGCGSEGSRKAVGRTGRSCMGV